MTLALSGSVCWRGEEPGARQQQPFFPVFFLLPSFSHCLADVPEAGLVLRPPHCLAVQGEQVN